MEPNEPLKDKRYSIRWEVSIWKNLTNSSPIVGDSLGSDMIRNEELIRLIADKKLPGHNDVGHTVKPHLQ